MNDSVLVANAFSTCNITMPVDHVHRNILVEAMDDQYAPDGG